MYLNIADERSVLKSLFSYLFSSNITPEINVKSEQIKLILPIFTFIAIQPSHPPLLTGGCHSIRNHIFDLADFFFLI